MKNINKIFIITIIALLITSCGQDKQDSLSIDTIGDKKINQVQFAAYLKFKRVPKNDQKRIDRLRKQYLERESLAAAISKQNLLDKDLINAELNEFKKEMLISRYFEKFLKDKITDSAIRNYYNSHSSDYEEKKAHVAHILIRTNKKMAEIERRAKLTIAQEAWSKLQAGSKIKDLAKQYSEDKISTKKGGDLGWIKQGSIDPRFSKIVFSLKSGEISKPFETAFGYHIVQLIEEVKIIKRPFKAVAGDIRYQLRNQAKKAEIERLGK
jgi:peptidyl-prolyl cis-trans isomerase C